MLKIENIHLSFENIHRPILTEITAQINPGDFVILIGGNGSGKSSLLKLINGLYKPTAGQIHFENQSLINKSLEEVSKEISTLTQDLRFSTFSSLTVIENCELVCMRHGKTPYNEQELSKYLSRFHPDLKDRLHTRTEHLSGGQRQTLALAMTLLYPPKLLLLDEHTSALDPKTAQNVMKLTSQVVAEKKITTIMITHELSDAAAYGNRLLALKEGRLIFEAENEKKFCLTKEDLLHLCY